MKERDYTTVVIALVFALTHGLMFIAGHETGSTKRIKEAIEHDAGRYVSDEKGYPKFQWFYKEAK